MQEPNQVPEKLVANDNQTIPSLNFPSASKSVEKNNKLNNIGIKIGGGILVLIVLIFLGIYLIKRGGYSSQSVSTTQENKQQTTTETNKNMNAYSQNELEQMLLPKGSSQKELDLQNVAINYIFKHPEEVNPFVYSELSSALLKQGNIEQAAFWFYIFQTRSGAWVAKSTDQSGYPALKASINSVLGQPINEWIASDVLAWHDLVVRAISYEKTFPFYKVTKQDEPSSSTDAEWQQALLDGRKKYEDGFNSAFEKIIANNGKDFYDQRKANGLYVGPWKNPGNPLLSEWK